MTRPSLNRTVSNWSSLLTPLTFTNLPLIAPWKMIYGGLTWIDVLLPVATRHSSVQRVATCRLQERVRFVQFRPTFRAADYHAFATAREQYAIGIAPQLQGIFHVGAFEIPLCSGHIPAVSFADQIPAPDKERVIQFQALSGELRDGFSQPPT
jgi:hypothetical protein